MGPGGRLQQLLRYWSELDSEPPTLLMLDDLTADTSDKTVHSVVHGVIRLEEMAPAYGAERRRLRVHKYRGMVTDLAMPGMNGVELTALARESRPGLPVLRATGYAELPSVRDSGLPRLGKPYEQADLKAQVDKLMQD